MYVWRFPLMEERVSCVYIWLGASIHGTRLIPTAGLCIALTRVFWQCSEAFLERVREVSDLNMDRFEVYVLRNVFHLPKEVLARLSQPPSPSPQAALPPTESRVSRPRDEDEDEDQDDDDDMCLARGGA
jgi:hypothetical protein